MADELSKIYYRIGDVALMLDLPASTIRFWEKQFDELKPKRNSGHTRHYTPSDIELLRVIRFLLKDKGLTIDGAREHLRKNRHGLDRRHEIVKRLQTVRRRLHDLLDALESRGKE